MVDGAQALWVLTLPDCSSDKSRLIRVDRNSGRQTRTDELGQWGQAMVAQGDQIWIAHARGPALTVADQGSLDATSVKVAGASLWSLAANSRNVFGGGREDENNNAGLVIMFDPATRTEIHRETVSQLVRKIISDEDHVVALGNKGTIWVFSARDLTLQRTITLSYGRLRAPWGDLPSGFNPDLGRSIPRRERCGVRGRGLAPRPAAEQPARCRSRRPRAR